MTEDDKFLISATVTIVKEAIFTHAVVTQIDIQALIVKTYNTLSSLSDSVDEDNDNVDSIHGTA